MSVFRNVTLSTCRLSTIDSLRFLQSLGKRLVFIAWETNFESYTPAGQQITQAVPDIRKTIRDNVAGLCQVVARLVFNENQVNVVSYYHQVITYLLRIN